jgi:hypothetical protein
MRYLEKQPIKVVRKDEGLTTKEKEALDDIMQRNDKVLKILAQM